MIGDHYWTIGPVIESCGDRWCVRLQFADRGFCEDDSTEGELRVRYQIHDLDRAIDVLLEDARKLGIQLGTLEGAAGDGGGLGPSVFVEDDDPEFVPEAIRQAQRLGWKPVYRSESSSAQTP